MSIFKKITILFFISFCLMLYFSFETNRINMGLFELFYIQKYQKTSKEILNLLTTNDLNAVLPYFNTQNFKIVDKNIDKNFKIKYSEKFDFGSVEILESEKKLYLLINYLDEKVMLFDASQDENLERLKVLDYLIFMDIFILFVIFFVVIKMLLPLKSIKFAMQKFQNGEFDFRLKEDNKNDEISQIKSQFNLMANSIFTLNNAKKEFLLDISHELRTPISKSLIALSFIQNSKYKEILQNAIKHMDSLTNELLSVEKLNSNHIKMELKDEFIVEFLLLGMEKLMSDEDKFDLEIKQNFKVLGDANYLSMAIKNILENALKYNDFSKQSKILIKIYDNNLEVITSGEKLSKPLNFYTQNFSQEANSKGYGIGLNLVKRILDMHKFELLHRHEDDKNCFIINFKPKNY